MHIKHFVDKLLVDVKLYFVSKCWVDIKHFDAIRMLTDVAYLLKNRLFQAQLAQETLLPIWQNIRLVFLG